MNHQKSVRSQSQLHLITPDARRRSLLLGLGSLATTSLLAACGAGGSQSEAAAGPAASVADAKRDVVLVAEAAKSAASGKTAASAAAPALILGVFSGGYDPTTAEAYEVWLGRQTAYNVDFLSGSSYNWDLGQWAPLKVKQASNNMLFSIPMNDMVGNVQGDHNALYSSMAEDIAKSYPDAIIRIGWEMNGGWYSWAAQGKATLYIEAYNQVASLFRRASASFMLEWCPANGASGAMDCETAYPGDTYVDCIGMDTYMDYRYGSGSSTSRWNWLVENPRGLAWQVAFAQAHGKKLSVPEWGVNADDPVFIQNMYKWLTQNQYHHASYWDSNSNFQGELRGGQYPNAAAEFIKLFGA